MPPSPDPKTGSPEAIPVRSSAMVSTGEILSGSGITPGPVKNGSTGGLRRVALLVLGIGLIWLGSVIRYNPSETVIGWESWLIHGTVPPTGLVRLMRVNELRELGLIPTVLGSAFLAMIAWDWLRPRH